MKVIKPTEEMIFIPGERDDEKTRAILKRYTEEQLARAYLDAQRDSLGRMFGHNAQHFLFLVADELLERGCTHIYNPWSNIEIRARQRRPAKGIV
jgi:hypothetical protein